MRVQYTTSNGRLVFESDVSTPKEAFEWLATIQELFEEPSCGLCHAVNWQCDVREFDGNAYYKLTCRDCGATLDCGQRRDGSNLFIKRKDADGHPLPHHGWYHYTPSDAARTPTGTSATRRPATAIRNGRVNTPHHEPTGEPVPF